MSYMSIMATVINGDAAANYPNVEIVKQRVKITAFAEADGDNIIVHVSEPDVIGPAVCGGKDVRVVIFEEPTGGEPVCTLFTVPEIRAGEIIVLGRRKL